MESDSSVTGDTAGTEGIVKDIPPQEKLESVRAHPVAPAAFHAPVFEEGIGYRPLLSEHDPDFDFLYEVYEQAFPPEERRNKEQLIEEMAQLEACVGLITYEGERAGLLIYWELETFIYGGHFAIREDFRGNGIGLLFLSQFLRWASKPVVLEVEKPQNKTAKRRIAFYERLGLKLFPCNYLQPSYEVGKEAVPLFLMESPAHTTGPNSEAEYLLPLAYEDICRDLYEMVYSDCIKPQIKR